MDGGMLSQDEINALLNGMSEDSGNTDETQSEAAEASSPENAGALGGDDALLRHRLLFPGARRAGLPPERAAGFRLFHDYGGTAHQRAAHVPESDV